MANNAYLDALRNSKTSDTKMILSPRRQIVENQKRRCYLCEKSFENITCYFAVVEGPDIGTGINSKELRAICAPCYFSLGKDPVKQLKKTRDLAKEREKEKKAEEEEKKLFRDLKIKEKNHDRYDDF